MNDIYGWRAKIGLIYIASAWVMEPEFIEMSPAGVITCTTRVALPNDVNVESVTEVGNRAIKATEVLTEAPLDVIALGCTSGSFVKGPEYDKEIISRMEKVSKGIPCTTTTSGVVAGLKSLKVKNIAVVTPYIDEINIKARNYLNANGYNVTNFKGLGLLKDHDINRVGLETVYKLAKETDTEDADAVFIACTGLRTIPIIQALEADLGKPVITAIQATFWHCLRLAGVNEKISGYGKLLEI